jgi:hypothetical protein
MQRRNRQYGPVEIVGRRIDHAKQIAGKRENYDAAVLPPKISSDTHRLERDH